MDKEQKELFRGKMKSYHFLICYLKEMNEKKKELYDEMSGLKGISYDRIPSTPNPEAAENYRLTMIDRIEEVDNEISIHQLKLDMLNVTLNRIADPERQMYLLKYRDRRTYEAIGKLFGYSPSGIFMRMDHALDEL